MLPLATGMPALAAYRYSDNMREGVWRSEMKDGKARIRQARSALARPPGQARAGNSQVSGMSNGTPISHEEDPGPNVVINDVSQMFASGHLNPVTYGIAAGLNDAQLRAFLILAIALLDRKRANDAGGEVNAPTVLLITGPGGCGKSKCLNSFTAWATEMGLGSYLLRAAPTGTAAAGILGQTLHSLCSFRRQAKKKAVLDDENDAIQQEPSREPTAASRKTFAGVEMLCTDEVSMVGHNLLSDVHDFLTKIFQRGKGLAFGGMLMAFFGDFYQFPPVGDTALYLDPPEKRGARAGETAFDRFKPALTDVVEMEELMRQIPGQEVFQGILGRLRKREANEADFDILQEHNLPHGRAAPDISGPEWHDALVLTRRHSNRTAICEARAKQHARELGQPCYAIGAKYFDNNKAIPTDAELEKLRRLSPNEHGSTDSVVFITLQSPTVMGYNIDTDQGITNGAFGRVVGIRFAPVDGDGNNGVDADGIHWLRQPPSIVFIKMDNPSPNLVQLTGLPVGVIPVYPSKKFSVSVKMDGVGEKRVFSTVQVPFYAAYAVTDYKAQGMSAKRLIIDFSTPPGTKAEAASAYVQLSRGRSLENIAILRNFTPGDLNGTSKKTNDEMRGQMGMLAEEAADTIVRLHARLKKEGWWGIYEAHQAEIARGNDG